MILGIFQFISPDFIFENFLPPARFYLVRSICTSPSFLSSRKALVFTGIESWRSSLAFLFLFSIFSTSSHPFQDIKVISPSPLSADDPIFHPVSWDDYFQARGLPTFPSCWKYFFNFSPSSLSPLGVPQRKTLFHLLYNDRPSCASLGLLSLLYKLPRARSATLLFLGLADPFPQSSLASSQPFPVYKQIRILFSPS